MVIHIIGLVAIKGAVSDSLKETLALPMYTIGPEEIFSGKILLFDANIFNPKQVYVEYADADGNNNGTTTLQKWKDNEVDRSTYQATGYYYWKDGKVTNNDEDKIYTSINNSAYELSSSIARWYYVVRTLALVLSMIVLLYIGIRIVVSSVAEEKAKYKQMLADWVIALCLIVLMHYIMVFAHSIVESVIDIIDQTQGKNVYVVVIDSPNDNLEKSIKKVEEQTGNTYLYEEGSDKFIKWPTNLMGQYRIAAQEYSNTMEHVGYTLAYAVLVLYTLAFALTYTKRLLYLLFLTVISPFVALTYPIDKIRDGKAQAFDMWLKEYIFNLLIQPLHLLLYTIFVTMAFELASTNVIYSLVIIGFMIPAEKFVRKMFGFDKAITPGFLAGASGAALTMTGINTLAKFARGGKGGGPGGNKSGGKDSESGNQDKIRTADKDKTFPNLIDDLANEDEPNRPIGPGQGDEPQSDPILNKYKSEGFGQNADGTYFNPYTNEYDENYDPHNDSSYDYIRQQEQPEQLPISGGGNDSEQKSDAQIRKERRARAIKEGWSRAIIGNTGARTIKGAMLKHAGSGIRFAAGTAAKTVVKTGVAGTGAMLGAAAGIATGDPSATLKNATGGAGAGWAIGSGVSNRVGTSINTFTDESRAEIEQIKKDYYGKDYQKVMNEKADKKFEKDKKIRKLYKEELGLKTEEDVDKAISDAKVYRQYGVTDDEIIIKAMKSKSGNSKERASKERIAAAKLSTSSQSEKDLQTNIKRLERNDKMSDAKVKGVESIVREINNL